MADTGDNPFGNWMQTPDQPQVQPAGGYQPQPAASSDQVTPVGDVAKVVGSRLKGGVEDIPGAVGDWRDIAKTTGKVAGNTLRSWLGKDPLTPEQEEGVDKNVKENEGFFTKLGDQLPNSDDIKRWLGYEPYQSTTDTGKWVDRNAGSMIEAVPSVIAGGGSSVLKKAAEEGLGTATKTAGKQLLRYDVAPQEITEKVVDPIGQTLGLTPEAQQVLDAFSKAGIAGITGLAEKPNYSKVPTGSDIRAAADAKFDNLTKSGFSVPRSTMQDLTGELDGELNKRGVFNQRYQPETWGLMQDLNDAAARRGPMDHGEMEMYQNRASEALDKAVASGNKNDIAAATIMHRGVENWMEKPTDAFDAVRENLRASGEDLEGPGPTPAPDQLNGDPQAQAQQWRQATDLAKLSRKVDAIQQAISNVGDVRDGHGNPAKVIQNNFSKLLTNPKVSRLFTPEEQAAIRDVVNSGGALQPLVDKVSKWGPVLGGAFGIISHNIGHLLPGVLEGSVAGNVVGALGKQGPTAAAENASARVRSEFNPDTGAVEKMQKISLRPGLRPALMVGGLYGARANQTPQQGQQSNQMENPFGSWFPQ